MPSEPETVERSYCTDVMSASSRTAGLTMEKMQFTTNFFGPKSGENPNPTTFLTADQLKRQNRSDKRGTRVTILTHNGQFAKSSEDVVTVRTLTFLPRS